MTDQVMPPVPPAPQTSTPPIAEPAANSVTTPADPAAKGKSPLDVLDQILNDAQTKNKKAEEEKEAERARQVAAETERKKQEDQQKIADELQALQGMTQTPQYQAKVEQAEAAEQKEAEYKEEMDGMEIRQLGHTKI